MLTVVCVVAMLCGLILGGCEENSDLENGEQVVVVESKESQKEHVPLPSRIKNAIKSFYIMPDSNIRIVLDFIMTVVILYNAIIAPYLAFFEEYTHVGFLVLNIVMVMVLLLVLVIKH